MLNPLQTHNIAMAGPLAEFVISLNTDGHVVSQGSIYDAIAKDSALQEEVKHEEEAVELDKLEDSADDTGQAVKKDKGKLVVSEEIAHGQVSWQARESKLPLHSTTLTKTLRSGS